MPCGVVWGIKVEDEGDVVLDVDGGECRGHVWCRRRWEGSPECSSQGSNGILVIVIHGGVTKVEEGSGIRGSV
jgi:predicted secreted hydrolase